MAEWGEYGFSRSGDESERLGLGTQGGCGFDTGRRDLRGDLGNDCGGELLCLASEGQPGRRVSEGEVSSRGSWRVRSRPTVGSCFVSCRTGDPVNLRNESSWQTVEPRVSEDSEPPSHKQSPVKYSAILTLTGDHRHARPESPIQCLVIE
jgi:hypothetical protein